MTGIKYSVLAADIASMSPRRMRPRLLDVIVACACLALITAPFVAVSGAVESPITEDTVNTDLSVPQFGLISMPINGSFGSGTSGRVDGAVSWDMYTSVANGMKLVVSADRSPALRDTKNNVDIADAASTPAPWVVASDARSFGFSAFGDLALARYGAGVDYRGFTGQTGVEIARQGGAFASTRSTVKLRAEYGAPLASNANVTMNIVGTAVVNL